MGYLCAYYRYYYPYEYITSFLNNADNDDDIINGTEYARKIGIKIQPPRWGLSQSGYFYSKEQGSISEGLSSIKYIGEKVANELYELSVSKEYTHFTEVLSDIFSKTSCDTRQIDILIKIDFFSCFGNQRELLRIAEMFLGMFKKGEASRIPRTKVDGTPLEPIMSKYATGLTKAGKPAQNYTILDIGSIMSEAEDIIKGLGLDDLDVIMKARNYADIMGYSGYVSGDDKDRPKLFVKDIFPVKRKSDRKQFGYSVVTRSIGSGKESRFTIMNSVYKRCPIGKGDIIHCLDYSRNGIYLTLTSYTLLSKNGGK